MAMSFELNEKEFEVEKRRQLAVAVGRGGKEFIK